MFQYYVLVAFHAKTQRDVVYVFDVCSGTNISLQIFYFTFPNIAVILLSGFFFFGCLYSLSSAMNKFIIIGNNKNNYVFIFDMVLYINSPCSQTSGQATKEIRPLFIPGGLTSKLVLLACENVCSDLLSRVTF